MRRTPVSRALALLLCAQPVFWASPVALAQTLEDQALQREAARRAGPFDGPSPVPREPFPSPEEGRAERPAASSAIPPTTAVDEPLDPDRYVCGPGDVLELNFWGVQNFRQRVTIDLEGRAFVAKVGYLNLLGKTLSEARRIMVQSVGRYFPGLGFGVALAEPRTFMVQLVDAVAKPGSYPARAIDRVGALIGRAGGFAPKASKRLIEIRRRDGTVVRADLLLYSLTGDVRHNPHLLDGDVVRVPFEKLAASVDGAVNRPGRYELVGSKDLAELVELGGGMAPTATRALPIRVVRRSEDERLKQQLNDFTAEGQLPALPIQNEDVVNIPSFQELQRSVTLVGATAGVSTPDDPAAVKRLPYAQGESVRTLLERVGGVGPLADLSGAYLMRDGSTLPVDLYTLIVLRDLKADRPVELGDTMVVPFKRRNIAVEGAVFRPGSYQYNPAYSLEQYLSLAGGLNRNAQGVSDVYLVTPEGQTKPYAPDLKVEPGSSLVAPERTFSRAEVVTLILAATGILLSGATLYVTAKK
jgi:protein involved in polysaccharide export with SLBB domain